MPYHTQSRLRPIGSRKPRSSYSRPSGGGRRNTKENIDPRRFVKAATPAVDVEVYLPTHQFADFDIHPSVQANLAANGYVTPTPIQDQAIPHGLAGKDVVGLANTGTGKTVAFAIPVIDHLMRKPGSRALIMAPTRELAQQIEAECRKVAKGSGLRGAVLIGGAAMMPQLRDLKGNPQIVIGTPGRIKDHMERRSLSLDAFDVVVLDEVDRMLDMGFIGDMQEILGKIKPERQSFFFSATLNPKVKNLVHSFVHDPITISVKTGDTSDNVEQSIIHAPRNRKLDELHQLLLKDAVTKALIFDDTQRSVERLAGELNNRGFDADAIHGGKSQGQRQRALNRFKKNEVTVLVATDVAARGIDVADISHVINFSTPQSYEDYVHRIGRAGRAGKTGHAVTFIEG
jgi:superfamily II DNA/RNA helicase